MYAIGADGGCDGRMEMVLDCVHIVCMYVYGWISRLHVRWTFTQSTCFHRSLVVDTVSIPSKAPRSLLHTQVRTYTHQ